MATPTANLHRFIEAVAWFRRRVPVTDAELATLEADAAEKAFWVSGAAELDLVEEVWEALDAAIEKGETLEQFRAKVFDRLSTAWVGTVANPAARLEVIFRTNVQLAYSKGRVAQLQEPAIAKVHPFWKFSSVLDARTSDICKPLNGMVLEADNPWWQSHTPPLHHQCRSTIIGLTNRAAQRVGVTQKPPDTKAAEGFGSLEDAEQWRPDPMKAPPPLRRIYRKKVAAAGRTSPRKPPGGQ
jgi:SPP1 gp7 family putative phage head morphogenesis protein